MAFIQISYKEGNFSEMYYFRDKMDLGGFFL